MDIFFIESFPITWVIMDIHDLFIETQMLVILLTCAFVK